MAQLKSMLTPEEYAKMYTTFKNNSQQDDIVRNAITKFIVDEYGGKAIDVMSIGLGTGWLEDDLIKNPQVRIKSLLAIEPNPCHVEKIKEKSATWNETTVEIDSSCYDVNYSTDKRFDIIMMIHSIYYSKNPIDAIIKAKSFLTKGGKLLIFVQGEKGGYELATAVFEQVNRSVSFTSSFHCIHGGLLAEWLKDKGITYSMKEFTEFFDVTDFMEGKETPDCNDTISFLLQAKYEDFDDELKDEINKIVKKRITVTENNRHMFGSGNSFIIVE